MCATFVLTDQFLLLTYHPLITNNSYHSQPCTFTDQFLLPTYQYLPTNIPPTYHFYVHVTLFQIRRSNFYSIQDGKIPTSTKGPSCQRDGTSAFTHIHVHSNPTERCLNIACAISCQWHFKTYSSGSSAVRSYFVFVVWNPSKTRILIGC